MKSVVKTFGIIYAVLAGLGSLIISVMYASAAESFLLFLVAVIALEFNVAMIAIIYFAVAELLENTEGLRYKLNAISDEMNKMEKQKTVSTPAQVRTESIPVIRNNYSSLASEAEKIKAGYWKCKCNKLNSPRITICDCGRDKEGNKVDTATEIKKFKELSDAGAITEEEFEAKKKQILGGFRRDTNSDSAGELKNYKDLLESGAITQEEFEIKKKQILGI